MTRLILLAPLAVLVACADWTADYDCAEGEYATGEVPIGDASNATVGACMALPEACVDIDPNDDVCIEAVCGETDGHAVLQGNDGELLIDCDL